jgi:hypothetical protein
MKFFTFLNIFLERVLLDKMKESMEKYLVFLLRFMCRLPKFSDTNEFKALRLHEWQYKIYASPMTEIKVKVQKFEREKGK